MLILSLDVKIASLIFIISFIIPIVDLLDNFWRGDTQVDRCKIIITPFELITKIIDKKTKLFLFE